MTGERKEFKRTGTGAVRLRSNSLDGYDRFRIQNKDQVRAFQDELKRNQTGQREIEELKATRFAIAAVEAYESKQETKGDAKSSNNEQRSGCTTMVSTSEVEFKTPIVKSLNNNLEYPMETENYFIGWSLINKADKRIGDISAYVSYDRIRENGAFDPRLFLQFVHKTSYQSHQNIFTISQLFHLFPPGTGKFLGVCPIAKDKIAIFINVDHESDLHVLTYNILTRQIAFFTSLQSLFIMNGHHQALLRKFSNGIVDYVALVIFEYNSSLEHIIILDFDKKPYELNQQISNNRHIIARKFFHEKYSFYDIEFFNQDTLIITQGQERKPDVFKIDLNKSSLVRDLAFPKIELNRQKFLDKFYNSMCKKYSNSNSKAYFPGSIIFFYDKTLNFMRAMHALIVGPQITYATAKYLPGQFVFYDSKTAMLSTFDALTEIVTDIDKLDFRVKSLFVEPTGFIRVLASNGTVYEYDKLSKEYQKWRDKYLSSCANLYMPIWSIIFEYTGGQHSFVFPKIGDLSPHIPEQWREAIHIYQAAQKSSEKTKALDFLVEQLSMSDNCLAEGYLAVKNTENAFPGVANKGMFARMGKLCQQIETESRASQSVRKKN